MPETKRQTAERGKVRPRREYLGEPNSVVAFGRHSLIAIIYQKSANQIHEVRRIEDPRCFVWKDAQTFGGGVNKASNDVPRLLQKLFLMLCCCACLVGAIHNEAAGIIANT